MRWSGLQIWSGIAPVKHGGAGFRPATTPTRVCAIRDRGILRGCFKWLDASPLAIMINGCDAGTRRVIGCPRR